MGDATPLPEGTLHDGFRLGAVGQDRARHCRRLPTPDVGRQARRAIAVGAELPVSLRTLQLAL